jgi:hypothetical protein
MELDQEISRGQRAAEVLDNDLYREAFDTLKARLMQQWAESPARDKEGRESLWLMTRLLENVESHLSEIMQTGKMARVQLEQQSLFERIKNTVGID